MADAATSRIGLSLSGGGARGAYQAGVLKAMAELASPRGEPVPFQIISGVSAGAINASYLAAHAHDFRLASDGLVKVWQNLTTEQVFRTDALALARIGGRLISDVSAGNLAAHKASRALLDTTPLRELLGKIPFHQIQTQIDNNYLEAVAITALDYASTCSVTFVQGRSELEPWQRLRRLSRFTRLTVDHVMASSAIPLFFPPIEIESRYYGDGCLRNTAPLSPPVHLDVDRLVILGVRKAASEVSLSESTPRPSVARILSVILNGVLMDAVDIDIERLSKVNQTLALAAQATSSDANYKQIEFCWVRPSLDLGKLAIDYTHRLPRLIRFLLGGLGSASEASELTSYLLFEPEYCRRLVELGYQDGMAERARLRQILKAPQPALVADGS